LDAGYHLGITDAGRTVQSWTRLSEQFFRFDKWSLCRG
jgi:hypothetical protein